MKRRVKGDGKGICGAAGVPAEVGHAGVHLDALNGELNPEDGLLGDLDEIAPLVASVGNDEQVLRGKEIPVEKVSNAVDTSHFLVRHETEADLPAGRQSQSFQCHCSIEARANS